MVAPSAAVPTLSVAGAGLFPSRGRDRLEEVARQTVERLREKVGERAGGREDGPAGVDRPVGARGAGVVPEDHFGVLDEIAIDRERRLAAFGGNRLGEAVPGRAACCGSRIPLLQEEDVDHDVRSCRGVHCAFGMRTAPIRSAMEAICSRAF